MKIRSAARGRWSRILASAFLATGAVVAVSGTAGAPAGAVGTIHKFAIPLKSTGPAVEKAARAQVTCNDANGFVKITVTNVQVIKADGVSPWDRPIFEGTPSDTWVLGITMGTTATPAVSDLLELRQNSTTGLFQYKGAIDPHNFPPFVDTADYCVTGGQVSIFDAGADGASAGNLIMNGTLT
jgi:hypothetical protein